MTSMTTEAIKFAEDCRRCIHARRPMSSEDGVGNADAILFIGTAGDVSTRLNAPF